MRLRFSLPLLLALMEPAFAGQPATPHPDILQSDMPQATRPQVAGAQVAGPQVAGPQAAVSQAAVLQAAVLGLERAPLGINRVVTPWTLYPLALSPETLVPVVLDPEALDPREPSSQAVNPGPIPAHAASVRPFGAPSSVLRTADGGVVGPDPSILCETAVSIAEHAYRLPPRLLGAISLTETGRFEAATGRVRPWPWTINAEGVGQFFATRQEAILAVQALQLRGVRSIDVGCLQVNLMYHPDAFASLEAAFDPRGNANYAARFLGLLYADVKQWTAAIAAYHSETPALGEAYQIQVMARWQNRAPGALATRRAVYGDFARSGNAYGDKVNWETTYAAFAPHTQVYGAFAPH